MNVGLCVENPETENVIYAMECNKKSAKVLFQEYKLIPQLASPIHCLKAHTSTSMTL